ncbi:MAG: UxaA family hydrolase [Acidobacteria bacterium]|nr:UxaA family hydrolase [Acidobacteriota bacterium]MBV8890609.1 UxaA family hydrolase [Acidobacteriota bacterium]MBV9480403.1 UxaA family hydrolase [Acidobacteriota bacterium]
MVAKTVSRKLLRIHKKDNVVIVVNPVQAGDRESVDGVEMVFTERIAIGHKVASRPIRQGEKIYKCGVPIGSAKADIPLGAHVHVHNLASDYIETYTLDKDRVYVK